MDTGNYWADLGKEGPIVAALLGFIGGLLRGWWVLGREHEELRRDRDYWREAANRAAGIAETPIRVAERRASHERD
ncbi:MAG TPA: hypothetical protein DEU95_06360 [Chloroflexi bacterium]|jgi:hypothetical protein|nr:hypothetical protein [Chloroflexota bacterium]HCG29359.1 hypothetical protein [Chloroflexota bacterium]